MLYGLWRYGIYSYCYGFIVYVALYMQCHNYVYTMHAQVNATVLP